MNQTSEDAYGGRLNELALFAGAGGGILGGHILGWRTVCAVECNSYASDVLIARQNDGCLPPFPIWDDVRTFDGRRWRGVIDVVSGGFPCQDISSAGKGAGINGERSGLWKEFARIICEVRPRFAFVENSPVLTSRGLGTVLGDLASMGYDAEWCVLGADDVGAPHRRKRIWILAYPASLQCYGGEYFARKRTSPAAFPQPRNGRGADGVRGTSGVGQANAAHTDDSSSEGTTGPITGAQVQPRGSSCDSSSIHDANSAQREGNECPERVGAKHTNLSSASWWSSEPGMDRMVDGMAARVDIHGAHAGLQLDRVAKRAPGHNDRLNAIGNGQVPSTAVMAWKILYNRISSH